MISLVTPTGFRPEAFALCQKWMLQQTLPFDEWIVVDDSGEVKIDRPNISVIHNQDKSENTQAASLYAGLFDVNDGYVFIIEDDDYYPPEYIERMASLLTKNNLDLIGEGPANYYHIGTRKYRKLKNSTYSCLCQSAMTKRVAKLLLGIVAAEITPIDSVLWAAAKRSTNLNSIILDSRMCVGIKGMPGRGHSGVGWDPNIREWEKDDRKLSKLRELIPRKEDFEMYKELIEGMK